jgi:alcohol dehydrogenase class IV
MQKFSIKPAIYLSDNAVDALASLNAKKVFVIIDPTISKLGLGALVERTFINHKDVRLEVFTNVKPDPTIELIVEGVRALWKFCPDLVVSVGGGSAIDETKAVLYIYNKVMARHCPDFKKPFFAAIPTTSGTGSEVTEATVITFGNKKIILFDEEFLPDMAILDVEFTKNMPLPLLAETAADTLTHALETFVSRYANDFTDAVAEKSIKLVFRYLEEIFSGHDNLDARKKLHNAACIGGIGFTNASLGICHSMAHALGAACHVSHGKANGILLMETLAFNAKSQEIDRKLSHLCRELEISADCHGSCSGALVEKINTLFRFCGLPTTMRETGLSPEEFGKNVPTIARLALEDPCTAGNPITPTFENLIDILVRSY